MGNPLTTTVGKRSKQPNQLNSSIAVESSEKRFNERRPDLESGAFSAATLPITPPATRRAPARVRLPLWAAASIWLAVAAVAIVLVIQLATWGWSTVQTRNAAEPLVAANIGSAELESVTEDVIAPVDDAAEGSSIDADAALAVAESSSVDPITDSASAATQADASAAATTTDSAQPVAAAASDQVIVVDSTVGDGSADGNDFEAPNLPSDAILSPYWPDSIQQWETEIANAAAIYELPPDLLATILYWESRGNPTGQSYAGAVGLMGIMPKGSGLGLDNRPEAWQLADPQTNLNWGAQILAGYLIEAEGNLQMALAVYNAGWLFYDGANPQSYANTILQDYALSIATRYELTNLSAEWTIAWMDMETETLTAWPFVPDDALAAGWPLYGKHTLFHTDDLHLVGYAIPLD